MPYNIGDELFLSLKSLNKEILPFNKGERKPTHEQEMILYNKYPIVSGTPGSGKSFLGEYIGKYANSLVICPTYNRLEDFKKKGSRGVVIQQLNKHYINKIAKEDYKYIIVDECWMFNIINIKCLVELIKAIRTIKYIYMSGDEKQLPVIGFQEETKLFWNHPQLKQNIFTMDSNKNQRFVEAKNLLLFRKIYENYDSLNLSYLRREFKVISKDEFLNDYKSKIQNKYNKIKVIGFTNKVVSQFNKVISKVIYECIRCIKDIKISKDITCCIRCISKYEFVSLTNVKYHKKPDKDKLKLFSKKFKDSNCVIFQNKGSTMRLYTKKLKDSGKLIHNGEKININPCLTDPEFLEVKDKYFFIHREDLSNMLSLTYSYCCTIHKSQGETYDDVFFLDDGVSINCTNAHYYTAFTRSKKIADIMIVDTGLNVDSINSEQSFTSYVQKMFSTTDYQDIPDNFKYKLNFMSENIKKVCSYPKDKIRLLHIKNLKNYLESIK
jgi:hypothetical protein